MRERVHVSFFQQSRLAGMAMLHTLSMGQLGLYEVTEMKKFHSMIVLAALALALTCSAAMAAPRVSHVADATPSINATTTMPTVSNSKWGKNHSSTTQPLFGLRCGINLPLCYCMPGQPC